MSITTEAVRGGRRWRRRVYLSLGANLGDRAATINAALRALDERDDLRVEAVASLRETAPVGGVAQPDFLNTVCRVTTTLPAEALILTLQAVERLGGRDRLAETRRWGPRALDIDLILYDDEVFDTPVAVVPHREFHRRAFVLEPLLELSPRLVDPRTGLPIRRYREELSS